MARPDPAEILRRKLVETVRGVFNDVEGGEAPVPISEHALFERDSPIRMVHADVVSMMVGGIRGLLLQMLHPHALQGVLDHSNFRADMHGHVDSAEGGFDLGKQVILRCVELADIL